MAHIIKIKNPNIPYVEIWDDAFDEPTINAITEWVHQNNLGRRTAYNGWHLNSLHAVAQFVLKWG